MNKTESSNHSEPIRDKDFYLEYVVFLAENTLFNVPRYHFENFSEVFTTMYTLPHGDSLNADGSSDEHPLVLQGVTAQEFRSLLNVMLHPKSLPQLTKEGWLDVLKLSNMWRLSYIRNFIAIRKLNRRKDMSFTDKIVWGRCYKVADWMIAGYSGLIDRGDVLSLDEGVRIGVPGTLGIWRAQKVSGGGNDTRATVLEIFEEEIRDVQREDDEYGSRPSSPW
ncbi:uncharacterized protein ARMOST_04576 [Armillaria ostoyae]|uniref:BTB domain-containing protein n=1 Tax=Armillaria ostoyae TaxID=47428 RepID=A0A284QXR1_ARMOS|nr:uncharacterized protein ARMOST_04576 [Armillaria ostoyae]